MSDFTEAAHTEAWQRYPDPVDDDWGFEEESRRDFMAGARWARDYLAAQEPESESWEEAPFVIVKGSNLTYVAQRMDRGHGQQWFLPGVPGGYDRDMIAAMNPRPFDPTEARHE